MIKTLPVNKFCKCLLLAGGVLLPGLIPVQAYAQEPDKELLRASAFMLQSQYSKAEEFYSLAIKRDPDKTEYLKKRARCNYLAGKYPAAIADLQEVEKHKAGSVNYELAQCFASISEYEKALAYLKLHLQAPGRRPESEIKLDKAFQSLEKSSSWRELWLTDWYNKNEQLDAEIQYMLKSRQFLDAVNKLNTLIRGSRKNSNWYALRAECYWKLNEYGNALDDIDKAIELNKRIPDYYLQRINILTSLKKWNKLEADYGRLLKLDPYRPEIYRERANALLMDGEASAGRDEILLYLELFPDDAEGYLVAGKIAYEIGSYTESVMHFGKALELKPGIAEYYFRRGLSYLELLKYQDAIYDFSQALDLDPLMAEAWYRKGVARLYKGDTQGACSDLRQAGKLGHKEAYNRAAELCP